MADRTYPSFRDDQHHDSAQGAGAYDYDAREYAPPYYGDDAPAYAQQPYDDYAPQQYAEPHYSQTQYEPQQYAQPQYAQQHYVEPQPAAPHQPMFAQRSVPQMRAPQAAQPQPAQPVTYQMRAPRAEPRAEPRTQAYAAQLFSPDHGYDLPHYAMPTPMDRAVHWAGAVCSAAFVVWAGLWAYDLAVRDVNGIPVVRAAAGPLRIAPQTPGGEVSANQGLAVNAIAALGSAEPLPEEVTLAPQPLDLAAEDVSPATPALTELANETPEEMPMSDEAAVEAALAMALSEGGETAPEMTAEAEPELAAEPVSMSNTDTAEPVQMEDAAAVEAALDAPVAPPTAEVDPTTIPAGTKMVQLGAFDDDALARAEWANLQTRFADLIGTKALVVQQAKSGGRNFFRLRAHGFDTEDETRRFCAALLAENASCIPVAQR